MMPHPLAVLLLAVLLDLAFGDPPNAVHPVSWMGSAVALATSWRPQTGRLLPFLQGALLMLVGTGAVIATGFCLCLLVRQLPIFLSILAEAFVLKTTFSVRALVSAGCGVQSALLSGNLAQARRLLSWHLVSRDTSLLTESEVAAATIESLAENTSDSIVAPLLFYVCGGLPLALAYRFVNTCDAMLGYHDDEREWLGKVPARLDDVANAVPARLTAVLMISAGVLLGSSPAQAIRVWWRDCFATLSPNAGHPMSAAAGVLGTELQKAGQYCLGRGERTPNPSDIARAIRLLLVSSLIACIIFAALLIVLGPAP
jgi:adenosylcobinamide-phosphate synthase